MSFLAWRSANFRPGTGGRGNGGVGPLRGRTLAGRPRHPPSRQVEREEPSGGFRSWPGKAERAGAPRKSAARPNRRQQQQQQPKAAPAAGLAAPGLPRLLPGGRSPAWRGGDGEGAGFRDPLGRQPRRLQPRRALDWHRHRPLEWISPVPR